MIKANWFILSIIGLLCLSIMSFLITILAKKGYPVSFILLGIGVVFVIYYFCQTFIFTHSKFQITPITILILLLIGILSALGNLSAYQAASVAPNAGLALAIVSMQSMVVTFLAFIVFRDKLTTFQIIGIVFAVISIILINLGSRN